MSINIDPPDGSTVLAARHLDATEGRVQTGSTVDAATRSAITCVLDYVAKAHDSSSAPAERQSARADNAEDQLRRTRIELEHWQTSIVPELRAERDKARTALREVLAAFATVTSPTSGVPMGYQAPPIHPADMDRWRAALNPDKEPSMPDPTPTCTATIEGPHVVGGGPIQCTREAGHPENHVGPQQNGEGKVLWTDHNAGATPHGASGSGEG